MPWRCCVPGCKGYDEAKSMGVVFHGLPTRDPPRCRTWLRAIQNPRLGEDTPVSKYSGVRVCSLHFTPDDYEEDFRARILNTTPRPVLKSGAVPSVFPGRQRAEPGRSDAPPPAAKRSRAPVQSPGGLWSCRKLLTVSSGGGGREFLHRGVGGPAGGQLPLRTRVQLCDAVRRVRRRPGQGLYGCLQPQPDGAVQDVSDVWPAHRGEGGFPLGCTDEGEVALSWRTLGSVEVLASPERRASIESAASVFSLDERLQSQTQEGKSSSMFQFRNLPSIQRPSDAPAAGRRRISFMLDSSKGNCADCSGKSV